MKTIRVYERSKIYAGQRGKLTKDQYNALLKFNSSKGSKYFTPIYNGIKFNQYVGVISVGNLTIEILPKLDSIEDEKSELWHSFLIDLFRECRILTPSAPTFASLKLKNNSILELYFKLFLSEIEYLIRTGLFKKYINKAENLNALKGKMDFNQHINKNLLHKECFYVNYKAYSYNHVVNQILSKAISIVSSLSDSPDIQDRVKSINLSFPEVDDLQVDESIFQKLEFNRKSEKYREALEIAKLLILNYSPDVQVGGNNVLALLFDMEELFEEYTFRRLKRHSLNNENITIKRQVSTKFWETRTIRPDIVLQIDGIRYVIDTKWKSLQQAYPDVNDLRQMYVYNQYFDGDISILLYPQAGSTSNLEGEFHIPQKLSGLIPEKDKCLIYFLPIINDGINRQACQEMLLDLQKRTN
ncbi:McrC family protein [Fodinibius saliphilus]|uniref:McrC family protein n=1 Tax=Fodinibius saliphilus TaxID=1920650 RepID=UPI00148703EB|nr:restriction endonuclease [Fodinibius saliphilus]